MSDDETTLKPKQSIRKFDVFAEFTRQERIEKGDAPDIAKGEGIWLAKVVASSGKLKKTDDGGKPKIDHPKTRFKSLKNNEQIEE